MIAKRHHVDWARKVQDLRECGMTLAEIGAEIGIRGPSVFAIKNGDTKDVMHATGVALLALHARKINAPSRPRKPPCRGAARNGGRGTP